jgi:hypothetical protein
VVWGWWLLIFLVTFLLYEGWALATGRMPLTGFVRLYTKQYPILIFILGLLTGLAALHFWGKGLCG